MPIQLAGQRGREGARGSALNEGAAGSLADKRAAGSSDRSAANGEQIVLDMLAIASHLPAKLVNKLRSQLYSTEMVLQQHFGTVNI